jgi:hypothetical protein
MSPSPTDALAARIEATFGASAPQIRRFALLAAAVMAFAFVLNTAKMVIDINAPGFDGQAIQLDFTAFWAAAKLALAGDAVSAFDPNVLRAAQQLPFSQPPGDLLWLYPPAWHIVIMPLGLLPFTAAYIVYSAVTIAAFALALRPLAAPLPGGVPLVLAGPGVLIILLLGNNSLLWTAGLVAALAMLAQGRMVLAGLLIALLTLKPQLGLLIPFALAFGGYWRTVLWACAGTVVIAAASTAAMGIDYWGHFFTMLRFMSDLMQTEIVRFERMMTWYALARLGGAGHGIAFVLQLAVSAAAVAAVAWAWSRENASTDIKAATLCIAIPLAAPYAYHYEMTLTLAAGMLLARDGFGANRSERLWLLALWLGPVPALALLGLLPPAVYAAPLLTATLALCVSRATRSGGQAEPHTNRRTAENEHG